MHKRAIVPILALLLLAGCDQKPEILARDAIAAAKGFIEKAQENHGAECIKKCDPAVVPTIQDPQACKSICNAINDAVRAQNAAIDALNLYCGGTGWESGGACNPKGDRLNRDNLQAAIKNLNAVIANVKEIIQ